MGVGDIVSVTDCVTAGSESSGSDSPEIPVLPRQYNAARYLIDRHAGEGRSGKVAFIDDQGTYTYGELAERVNRAGNMLKSLGVHGEQRVMLCLHDGVDFAAAFFGAVKIGAVPVPVNPVLTAADHEYMLRDTRARALVVSAPVLEHFRSIEPPPHLKAVVVSEAAPSELPNGYMGLDAQCAAASDRLEAADTVLDEVAFWLYTTGSTGKPKAVVHLQGDMFYTAVLYSERVTAMVESDLMFSTAKMCLAMGLGCSLTFPFHAGAAAVVMAARPTPETVIEVMRRHRPTIFWGVPTLYNRILADSTIKKSDGLDRLRLCYVGGETLPEKTFSHWQERFGVSLINAMGSTEVLHVYITNRIDNRQYRSGSIGKAVRGYEIKLLDEHGREVGPDEVGEVWVTGPSVSAGYWNNREATMKSFAGRWHRTGDRLIADADGYLYFAGRADDMLRVGSNWVSPVEVEACLGSHPEVLEAAVIGVPDADGLIKPKAFVVLRQGVQGTPQLAEELKEFAKGRLALFKYPRWIQFCAELPKTPMGKIQRFKLRSAAPA